MGGGALRNQVLVEKINILKDDTLIEERRVLVRKKYSALAKEESSFGGGCIYSELLSVLTKKFHQKKS